MSEYYFNREKQQKALNNFVDNITNTPEQVIEIDDVKLKVSENTFSPLVSEISMEFYINIVKNIEHNSNVLELGCGIGFFSIYLAKNSCKCIGMDISKESISVANFNAELNNLSESNVKFIQSDLFEKIEKSNCYDYIISTLPFTTENNCNNHINHKNAEIFFMPDKTLIKLFNQIKDFLNPRGKYIFSFGSSGNIALLNELIKLNNFTHNILFTFSKKEIGEEFYIMQIEK